MRHFRKSCSPQRSASQRLLLGGFIVAVGLLSLLDNLGVFNTAPIMSFWPAIFIVLGVSRMTNSQSARSTFIGACFVLAGGVLIADNLGYIEFRPEQWWPAFLIAGGISYILKGLNPPVIVNPTIPADVTTQAVPSSDMLDVVAIMSGSKVSNPTQHFKGGEVTAIMGGVEIDLRGASIDTEAILQVTTIMGSVELMVPNDWTVVVTGMPILGAIEDHSVPPINSTKRLVISGSAIMGGVEIRN